MKRYQYIILVCLTSYFSTSVCANPARMVRRGAIQREALHEAMAMCPEFINHKRKAEYVNNYKALLAPAYSARDPNRKSYEPNYIPSPEEKNAMAIELCGGHVTNPSAERQATMMVESESPLEISTLNEEDLNFRAPGVSDFKENFLPGSYFFFFFGTVCGMLTVFVYFQATGIARNQVPAHKSLRRPEL